MEVLFVFVLVPASCLILSVPYCVGKGVFLRVPAVGMDPPLVFIEHIHFVAGTTQHKWKTVDTSLDGKIHPYWGYSVHVDSSKYPWTF